MVEWCVTKMGECEVRDWKEQGPNICFPQEKFNHEKYVELEPDWKKMKTKFE